MPTGQLALETRWPRLCGAGRPGRCPPAATSRHGRAALGRISEAPLPAPGVAATRRPTCRRDRRNAQISGMGVYQAATRIKISTGSSDPHRRVSPGGGYLTRYKSDYVTESAQPPGRELRDGRQPGDRPRRRPTGRRVGASLRAYCLQEPGVAVAVLRAGPGRNVRTGSAWASVGWMWSAAGVARPAVSQPLGRVP